MYLGFRDDKRATEFRDRGRWDERSWRVVMLRVVWFDDEDAGSRVVQGEGLSSILTSMKVGTG